MCEFFKMMWSSGRISAAVAKVADGFLKESTDVYAVEYPSALPRGQTVEKVAKTTRFKKLLI